MAKKKIFVSCGQDTPEEIMFGKEILKVVGDQGMDGFFADTIHQPADVNAFLFKKLQICDGCIAVLQKRGEVCYRDFSPTHRASVWIQQEIGILFYRCFLLGREIPMRIYLEDGIRHEGLTAYSIINPIPFTKKESVLEDVREWLRSPAFEQQPVIARREASFKHRITELVEQHWLLLELIAAHSPEPGEWAPVGQISNDFGSLTDLERELKVVFPKLMGKLVSLGLLNHRRDPAGGVEYVRINKPWWDLVVEELKNRGR